MPPATSKDYTPILVLLFISSLLLLLDLTGMLTGFKRLRSYLTYPLTTVSFTIKSSWINSLQSIFKGSSLKTENIELKQKLLELEAANEAYIEKIDTYKTLEDEINSIQKDREYKRSERARVLDLYTDNVRGKLKLNKGERSGITAGMPVVVGGVYIGYISEVTPFESTCVTYIIPGQEFVGYILKSKVSGIVKTEISTIEMTDLLATEQVKLHDMVSIRRENLPYFYSLGTISRAPPNDGSAERKALISEILSLDSISFVTIVIE